MIIPSTGGTNLPGNILGQVDLDYSRVASEQAETDVPMVFFDELCVWVTLSGDWRIFHMLEPDVLVGDSRKTIRKIQDHQEKKIGKKAIWGVLAENDETRISETNYFIPGEHPFVQICPFPKWNYMWGMAHMDVLTPLQEWMLERLERSSDILEGQVESPRSYTGVGGLREGRSAAFRRTATS